MDTKAAFEKWWEDIGCFANCSKKEAIIIWQASRAAIEIELRQFDEFQMVRYGTTEDYAKGYVDAQNNANNAITSHGIRIKGKTE